MKYILFIVFLFHAVLYHCLLLLLVVSKENAASSEL